MLHDTEHIIRAVRYAYGVTSRKRYHPLHETEHTTEVALSTGLMDLKTQEDTLSVVQPQLWKIGRVAMQLVANQ